MIYSFEFFMHVMPISRFRPPAVLLFWSISLVCRADSGEEALVERARAIHQRVLTLDSHVDIAGSHYATQELDPGVDHPKLRCDLVKMARGGIDGVFLAVYVEQGSRDAAGYRSAYAAAMGKFDAIRRLTESMYPDRCALAESADQVEKIVTSGKKAIMIGVENGYPIGEDLGRLAEFYRLGARYMTLSHNGHNQICDSCRPSTRLKDQLIEHGGLSCFGRKVVAEMNRLGMMIDVSHVSPQTFYDAVKISKAPVIASHSGCRALNDHPRNLDDNQLRALAADGGVIQIVAYGPFLKRVAAGRETVDVRDFVDHIDHAVRVAGGEHVGIGSDFDGGASLSGFQNHADSLHVTVELVRRGYEESQIAAIWGGNLLRVWRAAEGVAADLQANESVKTRRASDPLEKHSLKARR